MIRRFSVAAMAFLWLGSVVHADEIQAAIDEFIGGAGFQRRDSGAVDEKLLPVFEDTGAMRPDGSASALEKALLLIDTIEGPLPRVRYMLRYGQMLDGDDGGSTPYSFVTVERYNFGPIIRQFAIEDFGEENVDDPEAFGVGPHVAWRIVTIPLMGQTAAIIEASRREMTEEEAAGNDCAGRYCLSYDMPLDEVREWHETPIEVDIATAYPRATEWGAPTPARATAELLVAAGLAQGDGGELSWHGPEQPEAARGTEPFLFVTIDFDLGQETNVDAALGQTLLNDDAIAETWVRRSEFSDTVNGTLYWLASTTERSR